MKFMTHDSLRLQPTYRLSPADLSTRETKDQIGLALIYYPTYHPTPSITAGSEETYQLIDLKG